MIHFNIYERVTFAIIFEYIEYVDAVEVSKLYKNKIVLLFPLFAIDHNFHRIDKIYDFQTIYIHVCTCTYTYAITANDTCHVG